MPVQGSDGSHGCLPPIGDYSPMVGRDWECPFCGARWRVYQYMRRDRGDRQGVWTIIPPSDKTDNEGMEYRPTWRLVTAGAKGRRSGPAKEGPSAESTYKVAFRAKWVPWCRMKIRLTRNTFVRDLKVSQGQWSEEVNATPGATVTLEVAPFDFVRPPRALHAEIYVNGKLVASGRTGNSTVPLLISYRLPLKKSQEGNSV